MKQGGTDGWAKLRAAEARLPLLVACIRAAASWGLDGLCTIALQHQSFDMAPHDLMYLRAMRNHT